LIVLLNIMPPKKLPDIKDLNRSSGLINNNNKRNRNNKKGSQKLPELQKNTSREAINKKKTDDDERRRLAKEKEMQYTESGKMAQEEHRKRTWDQYMKAIDEEAARVAAEKERLRKEEEARLAYEEWKRVSNGTVKLLYEQYDEEFAIVDGSTTQDNIDDVYCLSFVMPECSVHLSELSPQEIREKDAECLRMEDFFVKEEPKGTYLHMKKDTNYYIYVVQQEEQLKRDQERMRLIASQMENENSNSGGDNIVRDDGRGFEQCSCIYGNPCLDEYGCKDWDNRYAISTKNGWKGF
jgi:hypothetical protein